MNTRIIYPLLLAVSVMLSSCEKDTEGDGLTCADLNDDTMVVDGKLFTHHNDGAVICAETTLFGGTRLTHNRTMIYGSGSTLIMPLINITLSSLPPVGATTTYQLDNGMPWQISEPAVEGRATIRVNNHEETPEAQENWFSDSESGTVDVTVDASGNVSYNFSVLLVKNGGQLDDRKRFCAKNLLCQP
jgi:hypothetical protein